MPSIRAFVRRLASASISGFAALAVAQSPAPAPALPSPGNAASADLPLKEISVAADAFVRRAPLPGWSDLLTLEPVPPGSRRALAIRLEDTQLFVGDKPVLLVDQARQANDPGALGQLGQVSIAFIPQYQRLLLHKVLILRGDQVIDHTATVPVRFLQREAGLEQGLYSEVITASILLPDVRVGDTLHLQYSIEGANPIFGGRYVQGIPWQQPVPVQVRRVTLIAPEGRAIRWKWNGEGEPSTLMPETTVRGGLRRTRFEAHDMPGVELEPAMPRGSFPLRWLQFSEFADWTEVARWADGLFPADEPLPPELVPLVQRWLRLPSRADQASQALQWVQNEIRYYSVSLGESSHRPHSPAEVVRNRYGDCKDKSFLLMRLLQSMGIPARAVLASLSAPRDAARVLASPLAFDHVVVQAQLDGRDYFLDATRLGQRGPLDRMGQGLEDASVLVVDRATTAPITVVSPNRRELFHSELQERFKLDAFGQDGELESTQQWNGVQAEVLRLTLARMDTQGLQKRLLAGLDRRYPGVALIGTPELADEVDRNRFTLHARFKVPKLAVRADGNWTMRFVPGNLAGAVAAPPSGKRIFPLALPAFPVDVVYSAEMQWPAAVASVLDPVTVRVANPAFTAEVTRGFRGNVSRLSLHFVPLTGSVAPADVPGMLDDVRKVDLAIAGTMSVAADQVRDGGFLGIGRKSLRDTLDAREQATVARTTTAIAGGQLGGDDLAQALCVRSESQARLGRLPEALKDAQEAVKVAPALAEAWFCQGEAHWAQGEFGAADTEFGKALVYGHEAGDVYFQRGLARLFGDRIEQAADDFAKASLDRTDPSARLEALIWQAIALQRLGRPAPDGAPSMAGTGSWPAPVLAMYAGRAAPEEVLAQAQRLSGDERELALAEAWFYVGEYRVGARQPAKAREAFEAMRSAGGANFVESTAAAFELGRLGER